MATQPPQGDPGAADAPRQPRDKGSRVLRWATAATLVGAFLVYHSLDSSGAGIAVGVPTPPAVSSTASGGTYATTSPAGTGLSMPPSDPTRLSIPGIGVNAPFTPLYMDASGSLQPPPDTDRNLVGWYQGGVTPGETGNAIVAGHVDTTSGPAVFLLLSFMKKGDTAAITRADGSVAHFTVDSVQTFSKDAFPDKEVYGDTPDAELRLITCGGAFDRKSMNYEANVVVFAHLSSVSKS
ncbi:class F sortase [Actinacidiphila yeochonensis]|uniref:class F sortase n=1 Tax=Actinacidiphila yeochonensis TaxID=89050 RepID=UPI00056170B9|nr:class F sortase [Actinacidiphila yeochonensis]